MPGTGGLRRRVDDALGADSLRGLAPLLVRALRARFHSLARSGGPEREDFDESFGVRTDGIVSLSSLQIDSENRLGGARYQATTPRAFARVAAELPAGLIDRATFVDIGCGRGRVLLMAAELGFRKVIGIEFAEDLCQTARRNVEHYRASSAKPPSIAVEHADACLYPFSDEPTVFFLYNPFNRTVMRSFVANLERSLVRSPREVYVLYSLPFWREVWDASPTFSRVAGTSMWSEDWYAVYRGTVPGPPDQHKSQPGV